MRRRYFWAAIALVSVLIIATDPAVAQRSGGGSDGGALIDIIINALIGFLKEVSSPIISVIENNGRELVKTIVGTPHPNSVFIAPTNGPWPRLYDYYWSAIIPLSLSLFGVALGVVILLESTSHLFSGYHRSKLKKRAFSGLIGILSWWWIAAISLRFMDALTGVLIPSLSNITLFETASFSGMGVLGFVLSLGVDLGLFVLLAMIYLTRQLVLYLFVLMMPLLIVMWIPGVGPFALLSRFVKTLAGFYVPFLFMTVPVAILFRLGEILGGSFGMSAGGIGAWLTAIIIPFLAVLSPIVLVWQAGGIFFLGDRMARRVSTQRAQGRIARARTRTRDAARGGRNFARGLRNKPAIRESGQTVFDSGDSTAHATGDRVRRSLSSDGGMDAQSRATDFENLRDR